MTLRNSRSARPNLASNELHFRLVSGDSLFDNISFRDPKPDRAWIETCARQAAIHQEISAMPMGYFTRVGDMGMEFSDAQNNESCWPGHDANARGSCCSTRRRASSIVSRTSESAETTPRQLRSA
jgi:hypothetical protein